MRTLLYLEFKWPAINAKYLYLYRLCSNKFAYVNHSRHFGTVCHVFHCIEPLAATSLSAALTDVHPTLPRDHRSRDAVASSPPQKQLVEKKPNDNKQSKRLTTRKSTVQPKQNTENSWVCCWFNLHSTPHTLDWFCSPLSHKGNKMQVGVLLKPGGRPKLHVPWPHYLQYN